MMFDSRRFLALLTARNREFLRDRTALLWNVVMPVIIVFGFAYAFNKEEVLLPGRDIRFGLRVRF